MGEQIIFTAETDHGTQVMVTVWLADDATYHAELALRCNDHAIWGPPLELVQHG